MPVDTERVAMTQPAPTPTAPPPGDPAPVPTDPNSTPQPAPPANPAGGEPLGAEGEKALQLQRQRARTAETLIAEMAGMSKTQVKAMLDKAFDVEQKKSEVELLNERLAQHEKSLADERSTRWRLEVAQAKSLTPEQAAWLQGSTQEELLASADRLLAAFPAQPAGPRTPAPDPSQGARGGQPGPDLQAQIAALKAKGDILGAIALERSKLNNIQRPS
jgi:hypothetical protein